MLSLECASGNFLQPAASIREVGNVQAQTWIILIQDQGGFS